MRIGCRKFFPFLFVKKFLTEMESVCMGKTDKNNKFILAEINISFTNVKINKL